MSVRLVSWEEEDGPLTEKRLMGVLEREGYEVAVYAHRQGTVFPEHEHAQEKCDAVVEGFLRIAVGETVYELKPGIESIEVLLFPPVGRGSDVGVAASRNILDAIQDLDSQVRVLGGLGVSRQVREICPDEVRQQSLEFRFGQSRLTRGVVPAASAIELRLDAPSGDP